MSSYQQVSPYFYCSIPVKRVGVSMTVPARLSAAFVLALMVGTGGFSDARYLQKRQDRGYALAAVKPSAADVITFSRTAAENLERVRSVLNPSVSDLSRIFGVSRQTIYNWANGEQPKAHYSDRIEDLARAADILAAVGTSDLRQALKRKITSGRSLLEIAAAGESVSDAAGKLAKILSREADERKRILAKLSGRNQPSQIEDQGTPMLDETT